MACEQRTIGLCSLATWGNLGQQDGCVMQVLQRRWNSTFSQHSYGFRPRRSAHHAVAQAQQYLAQGYEWVIDLDLENFSIGSITIS
jgi:hypothetical protein